MSVACFYFRRLRYQLLKLELVHFSGTVAPTAILSPATSKLDFLFVVCFFSLFLVCFAFWGVVGVSFFVVSFFFFFFRRRRRRERGVSLYSLLTCTRPEGLVQALSRYTCRTHIALCESKSRQGHLTHCTI